MASTPGSVDEQGTPHVRISILPGGQSGPGKEIDAVVDTGFTGFVQMPLVAAESLGLVAIGEAAVSYADGSTVDVPMAWATVRLGAELADGFVHLEQYGTEILVGVHFLRLFRKTLVFSPTEARIVLTDRTISEIAGSGTGGP